MKRPFPRIERHALLGLAAALTTLGAGCSPNQSVNPGAPVLTEIKIVEGGGATITTIPSSVAECPAAATDGGPDGAVDGGTAPNINGGMCDPAVVICRQTSASNWCRCVANSPPSAPPAPSPCTDAGATGTAGSADAGASADASDAAAVLGGTWNCAPFSPNSMALFVFDRLLDTVPLDAGDVTNAATVAFAPPPRMPVVVNADYASNGSPNEVIFSDPNVLGDYRADGPSLLFTGQPELPTSSTFTIILDGTKVRAKDGKTPFTGPGLFAEGKLAFTTAALSATLTVPPPQAPSADAGACTPPPTTALPDMTPATLTFNNVVCPQLPDGTFDTTAIAKDITITAGAAAVAFTAKSADGLTVSIVPKVNWPASSTITITIDATVTDLLGDPLGAAVPPGVFTTSAM
jgi:hypothetical protein